MALSHSNASTAIICAKWQVSVEPSKKANEIRISGEYIEFYYITKDSTKTKIFAPSFPRWILYRF